MKTPLVVYANCQSGPLGSILSTLSDDLVVLKVDPVHVLKPDRLAAVEAQFDKASVIVHQPIGPGFRDFSVAALKKKFPRKRWISFPSLYFAAYSPNLMYLRKPGGGTLRGVLNDYHDDRVVQGFLRGLSVPQMLGELARADPVAGDEAIRHALGVLAERDAGVDIGCAGFIEAQFRTQRLFHVMNHPANAVLVQVALGVLARLGLPAKAGAADRLCAAPCFLSNYQVPIEASVLAAIRSDRLVAGHYSLRQDGADVGMTTEQFVAGSFRTYASTPDFGRLYAYAAERRKVMN
jgi:hypothetical protein